MTVGLFCSFSTPRIQPGQRSIRWSAVTRRWATMRRSAGSRESPATEWHECRCCHPRGFRSFPVPIASDATDPHPRRTRSVPCCCVVLLPSTRARKRRLHPTALHGQWPAAVPRPNCALPNPSHSTTCVSSRITEQARGPGGSWLPTPHRRAQRCPPVSRFFLCLRQKGSSDSGDRVSAVRPVCRFW